MSEALLLLLSEEQIRNNWRHIANDPDNPRRDITNPDDFIKEVKAGNITSLGAKLVLTEKL